jgi:VWFA-related protein
VNVIVIDALDSPMVAQMYLRQQLIAFMKTAPPGHLFAIFQMDSSMHLVQGFTSDPALLLKAVESKRDSIVMKPVLGVDRRQRRQILNGGLREMGRYLAGFPGRKNLIWFTGEVPRAVFGLRANPFPDEVDYDMSRGQAANALSLSRISLYPIDDRGLEMRWHPFNQMELERIANATGGKAFFNTNGMKEALTQIVETGSNYYTIAYAPTNDVWNAHHRDLEIAVPGRPGVMLLYRHRYYARRERKAQRNADKKQAAAESEQAEQSAPESEAGDEEAASTPKEDFATSMELGQMPAGEVVFSVSVTPAKSATKLHKDEPLPPGSLLRTDFQRKPFREDELMFVIDPSRVQFELGIDGKHHAEMELVTVVYDSEGKVLNSVSTLSSVNFDDAMYAKVMRREVTATPASKLAGGPVFVSAHQVVEVPEKVNAFFRFGVYDTSSERIGTMEVPVDNVVAGARR